MFEELNRIKACSEHEYREHASRNQETLHLNEVALEQLQRSHELECSELQRDCDRRLAEVEQEHCQRLQRSEDDYTRDLVESKADHEREMYEMRAAHEEMVCELNLDRDCRIDNIIQDHSNDSENLQKIHNLQFTAEQSKHEHLVSELKAEHSKDVQRLQLEHSQQVDTLSREHSETLKAAEEEQKELSAILETKHAHILADLLCNFKQTIHQLTSTTLTIDNLGECQCEPIALQPTEFMDQETSDTFASTNENLKLLQLEYKETFKKLRVSNESDLNDQRVKFDDDVSSMRNQHIEDVEQLRKQFKLEAERLATSHAEDAAEIRRLADVQCDEYAVEINNLKVEHRCELERGKADWAAVSKAVDLSHNEEMDVLTSNHIFELNELREQLKSVASAQDDSLQLANARLVDNRKLAERNANLAKELETVEKVCKQLKSLNEDATQQLAKAQADFVTSQQESSTSKVGVNIM